MPYRSLALAAATVLFLGGLTIAVVGMRLLKSNPGLALGLMAGGFAVVITGSWVSTRPTRARGDEHPTRGA